MTEEYKQSIVDSIIAQRQLADNDPFVTELNGYVKENISDSLFISAIVTVCLIATAYISEIVRSGIESVHQTQWDAAIAMNFSYYETLKEVIFPQAWKVIFPPAFSFFILFIKDTALASQIGVMELTFAGKVLNNKGFSPILVFGTILILYFILSFPLDRFGKYMETRYATNPNRK